ncbi:MAG: sulfite exporter TauE/SafE family protein [Limisphaerales bacterium]
MTYLIAGLIGMFGGVASGLFGVGGGIVMVPAMMYFMNMPIHKAVGTSLVVIIPTALVGSWKHYHNGNLVWPAAWSLIPMAVIGGFAGAWLANELPAATLKRLFGGFLIFVGVRLLFFR